MRWLFMYFCTIGLFTAVVTYSRYITVSVPEPTSARAAKFDITVKFDDMCGNKGESESCTYDIRPTEKIDYYFSVDTTQLEVDIDFETYIDVDIDNFVIDKLVDTDGNEYKEGANYNLESGRITMTERIKATQGYNRHYILTVVPKENAQGKNYERAVVIGYEATQVETTKNN